jgi:hypothetical protein
MHPNKEMTKEMTKEIVTRFTYHPATEATGEIHGTLRALHMELAFKIQEITPQSREQSLALTALQESLLWSNAAIACRLVE